MIRPFSPETFLNSGEANAEGPNVQHLQHPRVSAIQHTASRSPPPPYVPLPPVNSGGPNSTSSDFSEGAGTLYLPPTQNPLFHPQFSHQDQQRFGPTPLSTTIPLLPYAYYEPQGAADSRARRRFVCSVMAALGVWLFVSVVVGLEVLGETAWWWW